SLTAQNAGVYVARGADRTRIERCVLVYNLVGLWIERSAVVRVTGNVIVGKRGVLSPRRGNGIQLYNPTGAGLAGNSVS
ncbi:nitrous oxide reductase family maturation protein NosD, partial [Burkholderia pseudomallei]